MLDRHEARWEDISKTCFKIGWVCEDCVYLAQYSDLGELSCEWQ